MTTLAASRHTHSTHIYEMERLSFKWQKERTEEKEKKFVNYKNILSMKKRRREDDDDKKMRHQQ